MLTLSYAGGSYRLPVSLAGGESRTVDVGKLIHLQTPDAGGNTIPNAVTQGSAILSGPKGEGDLMEVATSASIFNVRTATCGVICNSCNGIGSVYLDGSPLTLGIGSSQQGVAMIQLQTGSTQQASSYGWSSQKSSVASTTTSGLAKGVAPGLANLDFSIDTDGFYGAGELCSGFAPYTCPEAPSSGGGQANVPPTVSISGPTTVISGNQIQLTATGAPSGGTYSWSTSNTDVVLLSNSGSSVTVVGNSVGSSTITVTYTQSELPGTATQVETVQSAPNSTPIVTGIDPSDWNSGATTPNVTFSGKNFGTNTPTLMFSPSNGITYSLTPGGYNDTQIVANINVASGVSTEDVSVTVTNNGYGGNSFQSGGGQASPTSTPVYAHVHAPMNTPEITVVAWVDSNFTLPTGENPTLQSALNTTVGCVAQITNLEFQNLGLVVAGTPDVAYTNAWLVQNSANYNSATNPIPSTITPSVIYSARNFRLFNDFGNGGGTYRLGRTPDPFRVRLKSHSQVSTSDTQIRRHQVRSIR